MDPRDAADKPDSNGQPPGPAAADMVKGKFYVELHTGSGISDESILGNRLFTTEDEEQVDAILDYKGSHAFGLTLVIPFYDATGRQIGNGRVQFGRLKPTNPRPLKGGAPKYESP